MNEIYVVLDKDNCEIIMSGFNYNMILLSLNIINGIDIESSKIISMKEKNKSSVFSNSEVVLEITYQFDNGLIKTYEIWSVNIEK